MSLLITGVLRRHPTNTAFAGLFIFIFSVYIFAHTFFRLPSSTSSASGAPLIPHKIWQIWVGAAPPAELGGVIGSWQLKNRDYIYTLLSSEGADAFARKHYASRPDVLEPFLELQFPVLRSDLLRYMLLEAEGGVYSDLDVTCRNAINEWVPKELESQVHAIVGIEYDEHAGTPEQSIQEPIQFCQWTMASSPNHPIMHKAVKNVMDNIKTYATNNDTKIADFNPRMMKL